MTSKEYASTLAAQLLCLTAVLPVAAENSRPRTAENTAVVAPTTPHYSVDFDWIATEGITGSWLTVHPTPAPSPSTTRAEIVSMITTDPAPLAPLISTPSVEFDITDEATPLQRIAPVSPQAGILLFSPSVAGNHAFQPASAGQFSVQDSNMREQ